MTADPSFSFLPVALELSDIDDVLWLDGDIPFNDVARYQALALVLILFSPL